MLCRLVPFLLLVTCAAAEEERDAIQWADELCGAYRKLDGYIATYHSERDGKALDALCAVDRASGGVVSELKLTKDGKTDGARWWSRGGDELFISSLDGTETARLSGMKSELKWCIDLESDIATGNAGEVQAPKEEKSCAFVPLLMLDKKNSISSGAGASSPGNPAWVTAVAAGSPPPHVDADTITFSTKESGDLTIDRRSGVLLRQSIVNEQGDSRFIAVVDLRVNPGQAAFNELLAGADGEHAVPKASMVLTAAQRVVYLELIVANVQRGAASYDKLESELASRRDGLRAIADSWIGQGKLVDDGVWKKVFDILKDNQRKLWQAKTPGAEKAGEQAFESYLADPDVRTASRELLVASVLASKLRGKILGEIFPIPIKTTNEAGEGAKTLLEDAFVRAYVEALGDRKFPDYWGERDGLH